MKKTAFFLCLCLILSLCAMRYALCAQLNLRATWTANTEPDMKEYRLYRTDGTRTLIGVIPHPTVQHDFSLTIPDNSSGTLTFVLTALDTAGNTSADSVPASFPYDLLAPTAPRNIIIIIRVP